MAQTLLTPSIIAKEALLVLENELVMANLVHRDYSNEFAKVGGTVTIRKPATFEATAFSTTLVVQEVVESSVQVVLDKFYDISATITSKELSLDIVDFSEQVLAPMMRAHAQNVDSLIFTDVYKDVAGHTPVSIQPSIGDLANLMAQLDIQKVPLTERRVVLHPITQAKYAALDAVLHADKRGKSLTIDEYRIGRILGADYYMDQNVPKFTTGMTQATLTGLVVTGLAVGATAGTVNTLTGAGTIGVGEVFKVAGSDRGYVNMVAAVSTAGTLAVLTSFLPAIDTAIAAAAVVTFQGTHRANLAFHKNAFALVTRPLEPYLGGVACSVANYKGISCRVAYEGTTSNKKNNISVDMLFGVKTLDRELAARLCLA